VCEYKLRSKMVSTGDYMYLLQHLDLYVDLYIWKNRALLKVSW